MPGVNVQQLYNFTLLTMRLVCAKQHHQNGGCVYRRDRELNWVDGKRTLDRSLGAHFFRSHKVQRSQRLVGQQAHRSMQLQSDVCQGFVAPTVALENELPCHGPQAWCVLITRSHTVIFQREYNFGCLASDLACTPKYLLTRQLLLSNWFVSGTSEGLFNRPFDDLSQYDREVSVELSEGVSFWAAMSLRKTNSDRA